MTLRRVVLEVGLLLVGLLTGYLLSQSSSIFIGDSDYPIGVLIPYSIWIVSILLALIGRRWSVAVGLILGWLIA